MHIVIPIFYIFFLLLTTPLHAQEWSPSFQNFEFGSARILSCFTGIKGQQKLYTGIHILPNPDWTIQDPQLSWTASDDSIGKAFIPFSQPFKNEFIYPAIFTLKQNKETTTYSAQGIIQACHLNENCDNFPLQFNIVLPPQTAFQTPQCLAILMALARAPKPSSIRGQAIANENKTVHITLQPPSSSNNIKFFNPDKTPLLLENLKYQPFLISFDISIQNPTDTHFLLQTPNDVYEIKLPIQDKTTPKLKPKIPTLDWIKLLLLSLIFSPLFMVWGYNNQISTKICKKYNYYICLAIGLATIIGIFCAFFPELWTEQPLNKYLSIILIIAILLWGKFSPFLVFLGIIFTPKPLWNILQIVSTTNRILFILILSLIWLLVFGWQIKYASKIHNFFQKWHKLTPLGQQTSFSLFLFLLLLYTIFYL